MNVSDSSNEAARGATIQGKWILLMLGLFALLVVVGSWSAIEWAKARRAAEPALDWSQRINWPSSPVVSTSLEQTGMAKIFEGGQYRNLSFHISQQEEQLVHQLADLATQGEAALKTEQAGQTIKRLAAANPEQFYAQWMLGTWHRLSGRPHEAAEAYQRAFGEVPGVLKLQYVDGEGNPMANLDIGTLMVECNRVENHTLDSSLHLVFPALVTDEAGFVYLPVYHTIYRLLQMPQPVGYRARYPALAWFDFPGRFGTLPQVVVQPID